ncbi:MAG: hypothetical protein ACE5IY_12070 [bacterium]
MNSRKYPLEMMTKVIFNPVADPDSSAGSQGRPVAGTNRQLSRLLQMVDFRVSRLVTTLQRDRD